jgi:hypothetical protein
VKKLDKLENLVRVARQNSKILDDWNDILLTKNIELSKEKWGFGIVWHCYKTLALKAFFIDSNIVQAKQNWFMCARIDELLMTKYDKNILDYGIDNLGYVLLSDCREKILKFSSITYTKFNRAINSGSMCYAVQLIMGDKLKALEEYLPILTKRSQKKSDAALEFDVDFFKAFIEKDKAKIEEALMKLADKKNHLYRSKHLGLTKEFISHPCIGYAKLCWLKDINVEINNLLIPKALLPILPNAEYVDIYNAIE